VNVHSFTVLDSTGAKVALSDYAGEVLLLVNVASKCGLTPQYEGLEALQQQFGSDGLQILGFPCNQFGGQEPGTDAEIQEFCSVNYSVTFPVLGKIDVNGETADPLYNYLREAAPDNFGPEFGMFDMINKRFPEWANTDAVKWNFTKFLIGRDGEVVKRYDPQTKPEEIGAELPPVLAG
jgi:glutathione peroxidase